MKPTIFRIFYHAFFILLTLGQLQRIQITSEYSIYGHEIVLIIWIFCSLGNVKEFVRKLLSKKSLSKAILLLVGFVALQYLTWAMLVGTSAATYAYIIRLLVYGSLLPLLYEAIRNKSISNSYLLNTLIAVSSGIAALGLVQYTLIPDTRFLVWNGWDDHYYRLISTLFDPGFTGILLSIGLLLTLSSAANRKSSWNVALSILFIVSILLTYSRATYVAITVSLCFLGIRKNTKLIIPLIVVSMIAVPFLPRPTGEGVRLERTASIFARIESNRSYMQSLSVAELLVGRGLYRQLPDATSAIPNHAVTPDNSLVFLFGSWGIVGSLLCINVLVRWIGKYPLSSRSQMVLLCVGIHSMFHNTLFYPWVVIYLIALLSMEERNNISKH